MSGSDTPTPTDIRIHQRSRQMQISFDNGSHFELPFEYLRVYSPSADGVFDATTEEFRFEISLKDCPQLVNGSNLLLVRACDSQENWTTARLLIQVELPAGARGLGNERKYFHLGN